jgi:hypothetical protein
MVAISLSAGATALLNRIEEIEGASLAISLLRALLVNAPSVSAKENIAEDILAHRSLPDTDMSEGLKSLENHYYTSCINLVSSEFKFLPVRLSVAPVSILSLSISFVSVVTCLGIKSLNFTGLDRSGCS